MALYLVPGFNMAATTGSIAMAMPGATKKRYMVVHPKELMARLSGRPANMLPTAEEQCHMGVT